MLFSNLVAQRKLRYFECGSPERFVKTSAQTGYRGEEPVQRTEIALFALLIARGGYNHEAHRRLAKERERERETRDLRSRELKIF